MKNLKPFSWLLLCILVSLLAACKGDDAKPKSKTEMISKNWKVRLVRVGNQVVYSNPAGSTPNSQNYDAYRLNFTSATAFTLIDINGNTTSGTWEFDENQNPKKITFSTGNPSEVNVETLSDESLIVTYTVTNPKTGSNEYRIELIPAQ
ncbi:hypothetical protein GXP67_08230 [Rhodocytophaga rosea]|uniref:Lipocalin-like domain-containing protein n=1 Tax=Rhodocytophaga rosea TaxID=2704465 RepID=A0A6C0GFP0_9BACT|nr:lipocalin family protein [Rhodocytophaga rosea]QHT66644.1 hypothetical protein GXP67_08230 [Rhodocytophaga rosea]